MSCRERREVANPRFISHETKKEAAYVYSDCNLYVPCNFLKLHCCIQKVRLELSVAALGDSVLRVQPPPGPSPDVWAFFFPFMLPPSAIPACCEGRRMVKNSIPTN